MKRFAIGLTIAVLLAGSRAAIGQVPHDPFIDHADNGETIHVLPTPAAVHSPRDTAPTFAPPVNETSVYPASYGSGNLIDHGGLEIGGQNGATFQAIYWNSSVATSNQTPGSVALSQYITDFIAAFPDGANWDNSTSDDYEVIQQYGSHAAISPALGNASPLTDNQPSQRSIGDSKIQSYLAGLFNSGKLSPDANTIYGVYFPSGMKITLSGGSSCSSFCGYHSHFTYSGTGAQIKYAVFPYLNCTACKLSNLTVGDMMTIVASHEIREAVTDPGDNNVNAWYDASGYEADDKCAWHNLYQMANGGAWVQPEYSNGGTVSGSTFPGPGCIVPNR